MHIRHDVVKIINYYMPIIQLIEETIQFIKNLDRAKTKDFQQEPTCKETLLIELCTCSYNCKRVAIKVIL